MSEQPAGAALQPVEPIGNLVPDVGGRGLPPSLQILLNEGLYTRIKQLSGVMAGARGMTPPHLIDKPEACFAIINMSLDWQLSPHFVARHTYQTPGGQIGFDGALVQAVLEKSGRFVGSPSFEFRGNWESLTGKFEIKDGARGGKYAAATWTSKDAVGLGVIVRWQVKGESTPRVWPGDDTPFWLTQCYPLNSPLWATDPKTQIQYLTIRRFANLTSPGILGAAAFDEDELLDASDRAVNITPEPRREDFARAATTATEVDERPEFPVWDNDAVEHILRDGGKAAEALAEVFREAARHNLPRLEGALENNQAVIEQLAREGFPDQATELAELYEQLRKELTSRPSHAGLAAEHPGPDIGSGTLQSSERDRSGDVSGRGGEHAAPSGEPVGRPQAGDDRRASAEGEGSSQPLPPSVEPQIRPLASETPGTANGPANPEPLHSAPAAATERPFPGDMPSKAAEPAANDGQREFFIPVPMRAGKPDFRTWAVALFMPKVRQQKEGDKLAFLIGDNDESLTEARNVLSPDDRRQLESTIEEAQRAAVWPT